MTLANFTKLGNVDNQQRERFFQSIPFRIIMQDTRIRPLLTAKIKRQQHRRPSLAVISAEIILRPQGNLTMPPKRIFKISTSSTLTCVPQFFCNLCLLSFFFLKDLSLTEKNLLYFFSFFYPFFVLKRTIDFL